MILEYHRPSKIEDVMSLLARADPPTILLGGGTALERFSTRPVAVVDLQAAGLNTVQRQGNMLEMGATLTLQNLAETLKNEKLENLAGLGQAIAHEATYNLRQVGTVAGALVTANGRSPFATAMLALDANLWLQPGDEQVCLGDLLPLRFERLSRRLITQITIPLNARLASSTSPARRPISRLSARRWRSGLPDGHAWRWEVLAVSRCWHSTVRKPKGSRSRRAAPTARQATNGLQPNTGRR